MRSKAGILSSRRDLIMDIFSTDAYGMYSTARYLNRAYNGPIIQAYKDSNGATQDMSAADIIDGTLTTFGGGGKVRVKILYDQSGNGNDASQTSRFNMPEIINSSGTLQTCNGLPAMDFDGGNDFMPLNSALPDINVGECSSFCVGQFDTTTFSAQQMMLSLGWTDNNGRWFMPSGWQGNFNFGYADDFDAEDQTADTNVHLFTGIAGSTQGNWQPSIDGSSIGTTPLESNDSGGVYGIGGAQTVSNYPLDGRVAEVLVYREDCSTVKSALEKNIMDYYNIS